MIKIAAIDAGLAYQSRTFDDPALAEHFGPCVPLRSLGSTNLSEFPCLTIPCRTNGERLAPHRARLADFMNDGGTLVVMGETHPHLFLDGVIFTPEPTNFWWWLETDADLGVRIKDPKHPLMLGIGQRDVTWHVHGTLAFDEESETIVDWQPSDTAGGAILAVQNRGKGRLVITTLDPIYHHGSGFMPATTAFLKGFLPALRSF